MRRQNARATAWALAQCRSIRTCSVSMPVMVRNAFIGAMVGPKSRSATARALVVKAKSPKFS